MPVDAVAGVGDLVSKGVIGVEECGEASASGPIRYAQPCRYGFAGDLFPRVDGSSSLVIQPMTSSTAIARIVEIFRMRHILPLRADTTKEGSSDPYCGDWNRGWA